jgi:hypothetical protein
MFIVDLIQNVQYFLQHRDPGNVKVYHSYPGSVSRVVTVVRDSCKLPFVRCCIVNGRSYYTKIIVLVGLENIRVL